MKKGIVIESTEKWTVLLTPEGEFIKIPSRPDHLEGKEIFFSGSAASVTTRRKRYRTQNMFRGLSAVAACLLLFFVISPLLGNTQAYAAVTIDINPSMELEVDKQANVIRVDSFNEEGQKLLEVIDWKDKPLSHVTEIVIQQAEQMGYMENIEQIIITTTYLQKEGKENINQLIEDTVKADQELTVVIIEGNKQWHQEAKEKHIPPGSYMLEKKVQQEGILLKDKNIKNIDVEELPAVRGVKVIKGQGKDKTSPDMQNNGEQKKKPKQEDKKQEKEIKKNEKNEKKEMKEAEKERKQQEKQEKPNKAKEVTQQKGEKQSPKHDLEAEKKKGKDGKQDRDDEPDDRNNKKGQGPNPHGPSSHVKDKNSDKKEQKNQKEKDKDKKEKEKEKEKEKDKDKKQSKNKEKDEDN